MLTPHLRALRALLVVGLVALGAGCVEVGPNYVRPSTRMPATYREAPAGSAVATSAIHPAHWWAIYHDPVLDGLVARVGLHNQSLKAAAARVREADALLAAAGAARVPSVTAGTVKVGRRNENDVGVAIGWEVDLWGRIRRENEAQAAAATASADDLAAATLSMQAQLVQGYFALREKTAVIGLLGPLVQVDQRWLRMVSNQHAEGVASHADVAAAQARLGRAQLQLDDARIAQAQLEHAVAVMLGEPPADFTLPPGPFDTVVPTVPPGLPATLLARRPDVAAAERRAAAASARIGVRKAEELPSVSLVGGVGLILGKLFATPTVKAPLYAGGELQANVSHAQAAYAEAVANYRQAVLDALREVEDSLAAQTLLAKSAAAQAAAAGSTRAARRAADNQYREGVADYQAVVEAQASALDGETRVLGLRLRRLDASVDLIKALGGGWNVAPAGAAVAPREAAHQMASRPPAARVP